MIIITHPDCTGYGEVGHPERPERITSSVDYLKEISEDYLKIEWRQPDLKYDASENPENIEPLVTRAHSHYHLVRIEEGLDFDADTPAYPDIDQHALRSVAAAVTGLDLVHKGEQVFVLMRPPGHHATRDRAMGFCYLNQVAIAALEARARGVERVAVLDFDVHHGNGTEAILKGKEGCLFVSIHQYPCYPGTGTKSFDNCLNYPVLPLTEAGEYLAVIKKAVAEIQKWRPDLLIVSAGFDAFKDDHIADQLLDAADFMQIGRMVAELQVPHLDVLEGGYSDQLPELVYQYLRGVTDPG
jgi:acetoin utilization deacetylase AcuC-like enzyme